jgi:hypothetical protein
MPRFRFLLPLALTCVALVIVSTVRLGNALRAAPRTVVQVR